MKIILLSSIILLAACTKTETKVSQENSTAVFTYSDRVYSQRSYDGDCAKFSTPMKLKKISFSGWRRESGYSDVTIITKKYPNQDNDSSLEVSNRYGIFLTFDGVSKPFFMELESQEKQNVADATNILVQKIVSLNKSGATLNVSCKSSTSYSLGKPTFPNLFFVRPAQTSADPSPAEGDKSEYAGVVKIENIEMN